MQQRSTGLIYGAFDLGQLRYVGKTKGNLATRAARHIAEARAYKSRCHRLHWIRSVLAAGRSPDFRVIQTLYATDDELCLAEKYWISYFKARGCRLVNNTDGGDGVSGYRFSAESRRRMSEAHKGRKRLPFSQATRARMVESARARWRSPEERRRASGTMSRVLLGNSRRRGKVDKLETQIRKSRAHGGRPFVDQHGKRYETQREAARVLGLSQGDVGRVLQGRYAQVKGFTFQYIESDQ